MPKLPNEPFDRALEIRNPPGNVRDAAVLVNDDLELCAKIYQQVSGKPSPRVGPIKWTSAEMAHILAIYDRFTAEKGRPPGDPHKSATKLA